MCSSGGHVRLRYFHTIKSILNSDDTCLKIRADIYFHTIKSILNFLDVTLPKTNEWYFHTIKSILNLSHAEYPVHQ